MLFSHFWKKICKLYHNLLIKWNVNSLRIKTAQKSCSFTIWGWGGPSTSLCLLLSSFWVSLPAGSRVCDGHCVSVMWHCVSLCFCCSVTKSGLTLFDCSTSGFPVRHTISWSLLKLMYIELVMLSNHLILCRPFSSCSQSFWGSWSFPMSQFFALGGQSIGASASASVLPMNVQSRFPLGLTDLISLLSKGRSRIFSSTTVQKHQFFIVQPSLWSNSHIHTWPSEKL